MTEEIILKACESVEYQKCRVCLSEARYDLNSSLFTYDSKEIILLDAFNEFSIIQNVNIHFVWQARFDKNSFFLSERQYFSMREMYGHVDFFVYLLPTH